MQLLKKADRIAGVSLRWLFDLATGNYFVHHERRIADRIAQLELLMKTSAMSVHLARDKSEMEALRSYKEGLQ